MRIRASMIAGLVCACTAAVVAPTAHAEPPPNDAPATPAPFAPYQAENGVPGEFQAVADLAEARADAGIPACLGRGSFERTVWYSVPGTATPRELRIEASGRTLDVVDLAAFVQRPGAPPDVRRPNACAGVGTGGADLAADRATALTIRIPAYHGVLVQVGRRGPAGSAENEQAVLSFSDIPLPAGVTPQGDRASLATPRLGRDGFATVALRGATTSAEDPAVPACASLGGVWRVARAPRGDRFTVTAVGAEVGTLSVFTGTRPSPAGFRGCVDREGPGPLTLPVRARGRRAVWIRLGTDRPPFGAKAVVAVRRARRGDRASGGACLGRPRGAVVGGRLAASSAVSARNTTRAVPLRLRVVGGPVCGARLTLVGPGGGTYALGQAAALRGGEVVVVRRTRRFVRGRYRLLVEGAGLAGVRVPVRSLLDFRLR